MGCTAHRLGRTLVLVVPSMGLVGLLLQDKSKVLLTVLMQLGLVELLIEEELGSEELVDKFLSTLGPLASFSASPFLALSLSGIKNGPVWFWIARLRLHRY